MELVDNGSQETRIAGFEANQELPVGVGILMAQASPPKGRQPRAQPRDRQRISFLLFQGRN
jgi:hypothetical protein